MKKKILKFVSQVGVEVEIGKTPELVGQIVLVLGLELAQVQTGKKVNAKFNVFQKSYYESSFQQSHKETSVSVSYYNQYNSPNSGPPASIIVSFSTRIYSENIPFFNKNIENLNKVPLLPIFYKLRIIAMKHPKSTKL
jgi:hypothetical protein